MYVYNIYHLGSNNQLPSITSGVRTARGTDAGEVTGAGPRETNGGPDKKVKHNSGPASVNPGMTSSPDPVTSPTMFGIPRLLAIVSKTWTALISIRPGQISLGGT